MTRKRIIIGISLLIVIVPAIIFNNYLYRGIRTRIIYSRHANLPHNNGAGYIYNLNILNYTPMLWGVNRTELKFLIQDRLRDISDLRYPAMAKFIYESENYLCYSIKRRTVFFYFNSDGMFYRVVERFPYTSNSHILIAFGEYDWRWIGKTYVSYFWSYGERMPSRFYELKWKNDSFESGYEYHSFTSESRSVYSPINIDDLIDGRTPFSDYPELEQTIKWEFEGMYIENKLWSNPDNPSLLMTEVVFTSTYLSGD